jgi:hypothetical protein
MDPEPKVRQVGDQVTGRAFQHGWRHRAGDQEDRVMEAGPDHENGQ